jgi:nucleoside-diphosphate-sugar epimerase
LHEDEVLPMKILIIGGTTFIGKLLVTELIKAGHEVSILHRKSRHAFGKKVANLTADRNDADSVRHAIGRQRFDAVYDIAYDWEHGTAAQQVEATALIFDGSVSRYV